MACRPVAPVFVVGASRSGTTLMSRVVGRGTDVCSLPEIHFFERLWQPASGNTPLARAEAVELAARLVHTQHRGLFYKQGSASEHTISAVAIVDAVADEPTPLAIYGSFLDHEARRRNGKRACDQTPRNVFFLSEILGAFPDARVVNMVRDPRAVLLSQKNKWRRRSLGEASLPRSEVVRSWSNYHPLVTARLWRAAVLAADRCADERVLTVRFEDLLGQPEATVRAVAAHCGVEYGAAMLDVPMESSSIASDDPERRGLRMEAADAWRDHDGLSATEIALCERVALPAMQAHAYEADQGRSQPVALAGWYAVVPVKLAIAAALNIRTIGNPLTALRRRLG
jgi:hypothetical protein